MASPNDLGRVVPPGLWPLIRPTHRTAAKLFTPSSLGPNRAVTLVEYLTAQHLKNARHPVPTASNPLHSVMVMTQDCLGRLAPAICLLAVNKKMLYEPVPSTDVRKRLEAMVTISGSRWRAFYKTETSGTISITFRRLDKTSVMVQSPMFLEIPDNQQFFIPVQLQTNMSAYLGRQVVDFRKIQACRLLSL